METLWKSTCRDKESHQEGECRSVKGPRWRGSVENRFRLPNRNNRSESSLAGLLKGVDVDIRFLTAGVVRSGHRLGKVSQRKGVESG